MTGTERAVLLIAVLLVLAGVGHVIGQVHERLITQVERGLTPLPGSIR